MLRFRFRCVVAAGLLLGCPLLAASQTAAGEAQQALPSGSVVRPRLISHVDPEFSVEARKRKVHGTVQVRIVVAADGQVRDPRVVQSAADAYSDPQDKAAAATLDAKAVEAVSAYRFEAGTKDGQPVAMQLTVQVSFQIYEKP